jgi:endonuclease/exonuclease/phosphatase family metal-dependent hydrolase
MFRGIACIASIALALALGTSCTPQATGRGLLQAGDSTSFLARGSDDAVRLFSLNVGANSIFPGARSRRDPGMRGRPERLARVIKAISPDIACIQEIFPPFSGASVGALLDSLVPLPEGARWQTHQVHDNVLASRFPLLARAGHTEDYGSGTPRGEAIATVGVNTPAGPRQLVAVCTHFQSGGGNENIRSRERHAAYIARWLRTSLHLVGADSMAENNAIVVMGDLNAYATDSAAHVGILLAGRSPLRPGATEDPLLTDARPTHNARGEDRYTWRQDAQRFAPGALDRILYNARKLTPRNAFVLNTLTMSDAELSRAGLTRVDIMMDINERVHDHYPLVVDLSWK